MNAQHLYDPFDVVLSIEDGYMPGFSSDEHDFLFLPPPEDDLDDTKIDVSLDGDHVKVSFSPYNAVRFVKAKDIFEGMYGHAVHTEGGVPGMSSMDIVLRKYPDTLATVLKTLSEVLPEASIHCSEEIIDILSAETQSEILFRM